MDELSILRARVTILERQMEETNFQLREFIEAFEEYRRHSRPFSPQGKVLHVWADGVGSGWNREEEDEVE